MIMNYTIEIEHEEDGRIIAEVIELPGVLAYGKSKEEAIAKVQALALHVIADRTLTVNPIMWSRTKYIQENSK